jgi:hypothetical protein
MKNDELDHGIIWQPHPGPQLRALLVDIYELLYGGARGGGKTDAGIVFMMEPIALPFYRGLVLRKNHTDLCDWISRAHVFYKSYGAKKSGNDFFFPSGAVIRTGHLKDADAYEKYQGHEYQRILIEELTQIPEENRYLKLLGSCRSTHPELRPSVFCTANPGGPGHGWVKKRFIDIGAPNVAHYRPLSENQEDAAILNVRGRNWRMFIPARIEDNPTLMQDETYLAYLDGLPEKFRKAWREGDWNILSGQYFPEFSRAKHVVRPFEIPKNWTIESGLDWGYSVDPWACLWAAIDEYGDVVIFKTDKGKFQVPSEVENQIVYKSNGKNPSSVVADPSMWGKRDGDSSAAKFEKLNIIKGDNSRIQGWMRIREYLREGPNGHPRLRIFDTCSELISNLEDLIHSEKNPEDAQDDPNIDHFPDALRYFLMSRPIEGDPPPKKEPETERAKTALKHRKRLMKRLKEE